jgi:hypothetical protein
MKRTAAGALAALLCVASALAQAPPPLPEQKKTDLKTKAGTFPMEVTTEFLGMANKKTVVRFRLSAPELSRGAAGKGISRFQGELRGAILQNGELSDVFKYPVAGDLSQDKVFTYSFLRAVAPGTWRFEMALGPVGGPDFGKAAVDLLVPELGTAFRPEMAPA